MSTEIASYEEMKKDRNLLKENLFSDNSDHAMIARTTLTGIHNAQLQKKYKLTDAMLSDLYGSRNNKRDSSESGNNKSTTKDKKKSLKGNQERAKDITQDIERETIGPNMPDGETVLVIDDGQIEDIPIAKAEENPPSEIDKHRHLKPDEKIKSALGDMSTLTNHEKKNEDSSEIQKSHKDATDEIEIELEVDGDESEKVTLEKEIAEDLKEIVLEEESDETSPKTRNTPPVDNLSAGEKKTNTEKIRKLSWGIPKALRLLDELDSFTGKTENNDQTNLRNFPSYLTAVRKCIMHAGILTAGHPTFQKKIGHLLKRFLQIRATDWEASAYGNRSANDMAYLSELMLNKVNTLDAYETEVKKLLEEKELGHQYIKHEAKNALRKGAKLATFGLSEFVVRHHQKKVYKNDLAEKQLTKTEEKIRKLEEKKEEDIKKLDEDIDKLNSKYHHTNLGAKLRDWKIEKKESKKEKLENQLDKKIDKIQTKKSTDGLRNQIDILDESVQSSSGVKKLYYRCKKYIKTEKLKEIEIADKIQTEISNASGIQADGFATAIEEDSSDDERAAAVAASIDATKSVHSKLQKKADPRNHEHLAMALHLLVRTIRDETNENAFYTAEYDSKAISNLIETYSKPYYDKSRSSSDTDAFDKFVLRADNNSNRILQRMLAIIMVYDNNNLLTNPGIQAVFKGENPDIFDINKGSTIWERNSFKFDNVNFNSLITDCTRINSNDPKDRCYESYNTIFEKNVFNQEFKNGLDNAKSKSILKCFCGNAGTDVQQKIYNLLTQTELSFKNINPILDKIYAPKSQNNKNSTQ